MRLAVIVQRYGADLNGGAELHARYIAERLSRHAEVEVFTTCARDYVSWRNEFPPGSDEVNGVPVHRFPVRRERDPQEFGRRSKRVFERAHSLADELRWLRSEGPESPALVRRLRRAVPTYDYLLFFSYRYYHAYHGIRAASRRAVLVPTAERDPALGLTVFGPVFRGVRALMYNSPEERALIQGVSANHDVPGVVVGVGSEIPVRGSARRFRGRTGIRGRLALYVGRIDENKGCGELFDFFQRYAAHVSDQLRLVLVGSALIDVPSHPRIHHLGFVSDEEKFDAMAAADLLVMPSYLESLSMVTLEAWAMRLPVLVNGACDVLRGQVVRSNGGLYYTSYDEFAEALHVIETRQDLRTGLALNGRAYFDRHYTWRTIERKYLSMLERLQEEDRAETPRRIEELPSWLGRRRRDRPPAREVVDALPTGPVLDPDPGPARRGPRRRRAGRARG
ncbi:MAG: glycosyltransferase [Acidobacteria bacterium]|nr:glycosyltransferase [Acidobacteriota bacterium]